MSKMFLKNKTNIRWILILLGFVCSGGMFTTCTAQDKADSIEKEPPFVQDVMSTPTSQPSLTKAFQHPSTDEVVIVNTLVVTESPFPTGLPSMTFTALPPMAATPSLTPTLDTAKLHEKWQIIDSRIAAMMLSNNGCNLPCWWGIELSDSIADAQKIFHGLNENGWFDSPSIRGDFQQVGFFRHEYRNEEGEQLFAGITVNLLAEGNAIKAFDIYVTGIGTDDIGSPTYGVFKKRLLRDWEQYSVQHLLASLSRPDRIHLLPRNFADGDNFYYELGIYYPDLGIVASYSFPLLGQSNNQETICLNFAGMDSMELYLFDPNTELINSYFQAVNILTPLATELSDDALQLLEGSDLESRTGMSIETFMHFAVDDGDEMDCFPVN